MPPFRYEGFVNPYASSIADLLAHGNDARARAAEQIGAAQARAVETSGAAWSGAVQNAAHAAAAIPGQIEQQKAQEQERTLRQSQIDSNARQVADLKALDTAFSAPGGREAIINALPGHLRPTVTKQFADADEAAAKVQKTTLENQQAASDYLGHLAATIRDHDYTPTSAQIALSHAKQTYADNPTMLGQIKKIEASIQADPAQTKAIVDAVIGSSLKQAETDIKASDSATRAKAADTGATRLALETPKIAAETQIAEQKAAGTEPLTAAQQATLAGTESTRVETERHNREQERISGLSAGRAEASAAETARHNLAMEESARNRVTNRPMLSGDAGRIADIDNSIKDVYALREEVTGNTGAVSKLGALVPNIITEYTGIGESAKQRQSQIDRVKQVIGKALEGGVLRKEDEEKYKLILPTIGDPPNVVKAKLDGLEAALKRKRETSLEALNDAGFNTEASQTRGAPVAPAKEAPKTPALTPGLQRLMDRK